MDQIHIDLMGRHDSFKDVSYTNMAERYRSYKVQLNYQSLKIKLYGYDILKTKSI